MAYKNLHKYSIFYTHIHIQMYMHACMREQQRSRERDREIDTCVLRETEKVGKILENLVQGLTHGKHSKNSIYHSF